MKRNRFINQIFSFTLLTGIALLGVGCRLSTSEPQPTLMAPTLVVQETPSATPLPATTPIVGLGVLGDSNSDEYHADDQRGGEFAAQTFNWVELVVNLRELNLGPWGTWDEPRRTGYEYNWSRSGATVHDAIVSGQHTGLAEQVAKGEVSHVIIWIGVNDFGIWNGKYQEIYDGTLSEEALQTKIDAISADVALAVDTILEAGEVNLLLVPISERLDSPDIVQQFPDEAGRRRVNEAIRAVNIRLMDVASTRDIAIVDTLALTQGLLQRLDNTGMLQIGNEQIDVFSKGNEPHYGRLDDSSGHPGTVVSGIVANEIVIRPLDEQFGANIPLLTDDEILQSAGLLRTK